jgi:hypothetical protein
MIEAELIEGHTNEVIDKNFNAMLLHSDMLPPESDSEEENELPRLEPFETIIEEAVSYTAEELVEKHIRAVCRSKDESRKDYIKRCILNDSREIVRTYEEELEINSSMKNKQAKKSINKKKVVIKKAWKQRRSILSKISFINFMNLMIQYFFLILVVEK